MSGKEIHENRHCFLPTLRATSFAPGTLRLFVACIIRTVSLVSTLSQFDSHSGQLSGTMISNRQRAKSDLPAKRLLERHFGWPS